MLRTDSITVTFFCQPLKTETSFSSSCRKWPEYSYFFPGDTDISRKSGHKIRIRQKKDGSSRKKKNSAATFSEKEQAASAAFY
jgi:hypothetical protein